MSVFSIYNIVMPPWTIEAILESEQMRTIEQWEANVKVKHGIRRWDGLIHSCYP